jgi:hypothetical protein
LFSKAVQNSKIHFVHVVPPKEQDSTHCSIRDNRKPYATQFRIERQTAPTTGAQLKSFPELPKVAAMSSGARHTSTSLMARLATHPIALIALRTDLDGERLLLLELAPNFSEPHLGG